MFLSVFFSTTFILILPGLPIVGEHYSGGVTAAGVSEGVARGHGSCEHIPGHLLC